jgi:hypothetical protein
MAKRAREQAVREKREEKAAKKAAAKTTGYAPPELDELGNPVIPRRDEWGNVIMPVAEAEAVDEPDGDAKGEVEAP